MSLRRNTIANYIGRLYVAFIGIVIVPAYLTYLGKEAYGLVGFFSMVQGWLQLLDMGLSTTLAREAARFNAGGYSGAIFRRLFTLVTRLFLGVAIVIATGSVLSADFIAASWLNVKTLPDNDVAYALSVVFY